MQSGPGSNLNQFDRFRREADIIEFVGGSRDPGTEVRLRMASFGRYSDDDAKKMFPEGWRSPKPYIRIVKQPEDARVHLPQATRG